MQLGSRIKCVSFNHSRIRVCRYISLGILLDVLSQYSSSDKDFVNESIHVLY